MKQFTLTENKRGGTSSSATFVSHTYSLTSGSFTASGEKVTVTRPTMKGKYNSNANGRNGLAGSWMICPTVNGVVGDTGGTGSWDPYIVYNNDGGPGGTFARAYNVEKALYTYSTRTWSFDTASLFDENNKNLRTLNIDWRILDQEDFWPSTGVMDTYNPGAMTMLAYIDLTSPMTLSAEGSITLNAPPTFDLVDSSDNPTTQVWFDTSYAYAGITTASIKVKNLSAQYEGDISSVAFTIGNQTVSSTSASAQTLSILLDTSGTFTPTVKVTDSRGQVTTKNLNEITVNTYATPTMLFSAERTNSAGVANDEGESVVVTAKFDWTDAVTTIAKPTVVVKDTNNLPISVTATWYKNRALTTPITESGWSEITEDMQVYCLLDNANHNAFNTQYSYQIAITPIDALERSGTTITQTLGGAFYTVDFLAGGHGIAFGQPSTEEGFFCNMDAHFVDKNKAMRALFDFIYPIGSYYETSKSSVPPSGSSTPTTADLAVLGDTWFDPRYVWGGTWELETSGQVHVSAGTGYSVGGALTNSSDGGSPYIQAHTHVYTRPTVSSSGAVTNGITGGSHSHSLDGTAKSNASGTNYTRPRSAGTATAAQYTTTSTTHTHNLPNHTHTLTGGGIGAVNGLPTGQTTGNAGNMQPYIVVNRWHRTA